MAYYIGSIEISEYMEHSGIQGMRWGVRRWQNEDGTYTEAGKLRYARTPNQLGYKPIGAGRGDVVQTKLAKKQIRNNKRMANYMRSRDTTKKELKNLEKAKMDYDDAKTDEEKEAVVKKYDLDIGEYGVGDRAFNSFYNDWKGDMEASVSYLDSRITKLGKRSANLALRQKLYYDDVKYMGTRYNDANVGAVMRRLRKDAKLKELYNE